MVVCVCAVFGFVFDIYVHVCLVCVLVFMSVFCTCLVCRYVFIVLSTGVHSMCA